MANKLKHPRLIHECNIAATRFRTMTATESQAATTTTVTQAEKGTKNTNSEKQSSAAVAQQQQQPPLRKTGQEKRMQVMLQRIVSGATSAAASADTGSHLRPRQFKSSWGGKSTWGIPTDTANDAESENVVSNDGVDSIYAWAASSTRVRYNIWGNAAGSAPNQATNSRNRSMASNRRSSNGLRGAPLE